MTDYPSPTALYLSLKVVEESGEAVVLPETADTNILWDLVNEMDQQPAAQSPAAPSPAVAAAAASRAAAASAKVAGAPARPNWEELPKEVVTLIALAIPDDFRSALAWCSTCRSFRAAQPPICSLQIGLREHQRPNGVHVPGRASPVSTRGLVVSFESPGMDKSVFWILERISPRHAAELNQICISTGKPRSRTPILQRPQQSYEDKFTSLQEFYISYEAAGSTEPPVYEEGLLKGTRVVAQLIKATAPTLTSLTISCRTLEVDVALLLILFPHLSNLEHLWINIVPFKVFSSQGIGKPDHTKLALEAANKHCINLVQPPHIVCHQAAWR